MSKLKKILLGVFIILCIFLLYHVNSLIYGIQQGVGQAKVLWNAKAINELMVDPHFPDSIKEKFILIDRIKHFSEEELGLKKTDNYTIYYDQKGMPILWVVTASPEFKIEAYEWKFPIVGGFPYKGFFDREKAIAEQEKMEKKGYDTDIGEVNAWSTLGWFTDPILSTMLSRSEGRLADLIIHESTHATLYVKDSAAFNENLASFFGRKGAEIFLRRQYGDSSTVVKKYQQSLERRRIYKKYMRNAIEDLKEKYEKLDTSLSIEELRSQKEQWMYEIKEGLFTINYFEDTAKARDAWKDFHFNNAYFSGFSTYSSDLPKLNRQLEEEFNGDLKAMITSFKKKYKSL